MEVLVGILAFCLVLSNALWLYFSREADKDALRERRELLNRIAKPDGVIAHPESIEVLERDREREQEAALEFAKATQMSEEERFEFAAVGQTDPEIHRQDSK